MANDKRYQVVKESVLGHGCCFDASVVDMQHDKEHKLYLVCECYSVELAEKICDALNISDDLDKAFDSAYNFD